MREIKCRGYDVENGKWIYGYIIKTVKGEIGIQKEVGQFKWKISTLVDIDSIGEYTGVNDKNGIEIYEGDLINYPFYKDMSGIMKYGEHRNPRDDIDTYYIGFYVEFKGEKHKTTMTKGLGYWLNDSLVCGNIYKNK